MITIQHKILYSPLFTDDGGWWMLEAGGGWWRVCGALVLGQLSDTAQYRTISYIYTNIYCLHLHITHHNTYLNSYLQLKVRPPVCHCVIKTISKLFYHRASYTILSDGWSDEMTLQISPCLNIHLFQIQLFERQEIWKASEELHAQFHWSLLLQKKQPL